MKRLLVLLSLIAFGASAQTNLSGGIYTSQTLTLAGSPYIVSGNLVVFDGVTITIEPGVTLKFNTGAGMELRGKLIAIGTATDSITFTTNQAVPNVGCWSGITVIGTTDPLGEGDQLTMEYVKGMYASKFVNLDIAYHGPYNFTNCYFAYNDKVNYDGGSPSTNFDHCIFEANNSALNWCQFENRVSHSYFYNNIIGLDGISVVDTCYFSGNTYYAMAPYGVTTGCVIENNNIGVKTGFNAVNHTFVNNTVENNVIGVEITSFFNGSQTFTGNTICNNSYYNLKLMTTNNANLGMNCWCSTDENEIRNTIFDGYDDVSYGLVSLSPVYTNCQAPLMAETAELSLDDPTIAAYPNPFKDVIHFSSDSNSSFTLQIFDMSGRVVAESSFENEFDYDGSELQSGIYYFSALSDKGIKLSGKLVKE